MSKFTFKSTHWWQKTMIQRVMAHLENRTDKIVKGFAHHPLHCRPIWLWHNSPNQCSEIPKTVPKVIYHFYCLVASLQPWHGEYRGTFVNRRPATLQGRDVYFPVVNTFHRHTHSVVSMCSSCYITGNSTPKQIRLVPQTQTLSVQLFLPRHTNWLLII